MWKALSCFVAAVALSVGACGEDSGRAASDHFVASRQPEKSFAPLLSLNGRERAFPVSTSYFLRNSGLEWVGGPCPGLEIDIAAGRNSLPLTGVKNLPRLQARRLGKEPAYRQRAVARGCAGYRSESFSSSQHTRVFDSEDRPPGVYLNEGFNLDILTDYQHGEKKLAPDGSLAGIPVYYAVERLDERRQLRVSYWLLFGRGEAIGPDGKTVVHEGDWERVDVVLRLRGRHRFTPVAVRYRVDSKMKVVPWTDVEHVGGTHPVVYIAPGSHTPYPHGDDTRKRLALRSWSRLRDVRREPWYGYGGGWGAFGFSDAESGPLGPSPYNLSSDTGMAPGGF